MNRSNDLNATGTFPQQPYEYPPGWNKIKNISTETCTKKYCIKIYTKITGINRS